MTNTELLNFRFVDRTNERILANEYISNKDNFILSVIGKNNAGKNFFINQLEKENKDTRFLIFDFNDAQGKNPLKYIAEVLYKNNNNKFAQFIKKNYKEISKVTSTAATRLLTINATSETIKLIAYLSDITCQFLDMYEHQDSSIGVISKYLKEIFQYENAIIVFKNLTCCDDYYINYIFKILKTTQTFQNIKVRFIISLDKDIIDINNKFSSELSKISYIPIKIENFKDSKCFLDILSNIFDITNKNSDYLNHLFNICNGYPGELYNILSTLYYDSFEIFKDNTSIKFNEEEIEKVIISKSEPIELDNYENIIITIVLFVEHNFTIRKLIEITKFVCDCLLLSKPKINFQDYCSELIYDKKLIIFGLDKGEPIVKFNDLHDKKYISKICEKSPYFKICSKYIYEYIKCNQDEFNANINTFYGNISYFSWKSESPDKIRINFDAGIYFYEHNEYSMAENTFLRIYEFYNELSSAELLKIAKCFYEVGNYKCALKILEYDKMKSLFNNYDFVLTKIRVLNICMKKNDAINQIDLSMHSNNFNNEKYELLDMKQRILSNIEGKRREAKIIYDDLYKDFNNGETDYNKFLISSMEYYRGEIVQSSFNILINEYKRTKNQIMLAETLTNKGFDLFWQGKSDDAIIEFNNSIDLLETLRIHEISYPLNNLANCYMIKGDYENAINSLKKALYFNESEYVDITLKNNLMVCYAIIDDPLYEKYFVELKEYLAKNNDTEIDISIVLKVNYSLGLVQDFFSNQNESLKNKCDNYTAVAINIANEYDQNTLPYLWFKDWKQEIEDDIEHSLIGDDYSSFKNIRFDPWLLTITHD